MDPLQSHQRWQNGRSTRDWEQTSAIRGPRHTRAGPNTGLFGEGRGGSLLNIIETLSRVVEFRDPLLAMEWKAPKKLRAARHVVWAGIKAVIGQVPSLYVLRHLSQQYEIMACDVSALGNFFDYLNLST